MVVRRLETLDTPAEERFDRLTRIALGLFQVPVCMITLIEDKRQWFKSAQGHLVEQTPRSEAFCNYTLLQDEPFVVFDALGDTRFQELIAVRQMGLRFYAGTAIFSSDGQPVGTLCILDRQPRAFLEDQVALLKDLAACAESELRVLRLTETELALKKELTEAKNQAVTDPVSRCWNELFIRRLLEREHSSANSLTVAVVDVGDLQQLNRELGREWTDCILRLAATRLRRALTDRTSIGRLGGSCFLAVLPEIGLSQAEELCEQLLKVFEKPFQTPEQQPRLHPTVGLAVARAESSESLLSRAEKALARALRRGPDSVDLAV